MIVYSSVVKTVDLGSFGPVGRSITAFRFFHLATGFELTPKSLANAPVSLDCLVLLDGPPLSWWRSCEEPGP
jgi:hypothetical protein